ncbi:MAG: HlyD family secretion protein, partial [Anaerolineales bacterium]|nr:HlyD family secretion protein [Anaerolineales bacterium]
TVAFGTPVVRIADTANFQIETTDLTEINVVNIKEGDAATVTLDAITDLELTGKVASIKGFGENKQGDIVYTIVVKLDKQDPRLRWNMTAKVTITK